MLIACIHHRLVKRQINIFENTTFLVAYTVLLPCFTLFNIHCAYLVSKIEAEPSIWLILYATFCRHISFLPALSVLGFRNSPKGGATRERAIKGFAWVNSFAKLNLSAFITHYVLINLILGTLTDRRVAVAWLFLKLLAASTAGGFLSYFFLEQPMVRLIEFLGGRRQIKHQRQD